MNVLFDHNVDRRFRRHLPGHSIKTTREMTWERLANGVLLREAAGAAFEVFLSVDKKLRYEQNLATLPIPIIVLDTLSNALPMLIPFAPHILMLFSGPLDRAIYVIDASGNINKLGGPSMTP